MIVDGGSIALLNAQLGYLAGCIWALFTNNVPDGRTNTLAMYTEAAWAGYARVMVGALGAPILVAPRAQSQPVTQPVFSNTSGAPQTFFGWMLLDPTATSLLAAVNLGPTTLPNGATFNINQTFTDKNE
jgi:hypothetical protein